MNLYYLDYIGNMNYMWLLYEYVKNGEEYEFQNCGLNRFEMKFEASNENEVQKGKINK